MTALTPIIPAVPLLQPPPPLPPVKAACRDAGPWPAVPVQYLPGVV